MYYMDNDLPAAREVLRLMIEEYDAVTEVSSLNKTSCQALRTNTNSFPIE